MDAATLVAAGMARNLPAALQSASSVVFVFEAHTSTTAAICIWLRLLCRASKRERPHGADAILYRVFEDQRAAM
jgi:hypothetical protein